MFILKMEHTSNSMLYYAFRREVSALNATNVDKKRQALDCNLCPFEIVYMCRRDEK